MREGYKKSLIKAAGFGAGFALMLASIAGGLLWYRSRPNPSNPWNESAIRATFDSVETEGEANTLVFHYIVENTTGSDYQIRDSSNVLIMAKLLRQDSLSAAGTEDLFRLDIPVFIPAKKRVFLGLHLGHYSGPSSPSDDASAEERKKHQAAVSEYVRNNLTNLGGFAILDEANHYRINLPIGR
jgi:hypothetical protein